MIVLIITSFDRGNDVIYSIGMYKGVRVGVSTFKDVSESFGKNYKLDTIAIHVLQTEGNGGYKYFVKMKYPKYSFIFNGLDLDSVKVNKVIFSGKFKGYTDLGYRIGKTKVRDVLLDNQNGKWSEVNGVFS